MNLAYVIFLLAVVVIVKSQPQSSYGAPSPSSSYGPPSGGGHGGHGGGYEEPESYEFGYRVRDEYSGSNFQQRENSDGTQVQGEYRVKLPDGRTQIVTYRADWRTGFHADVKYEGQATYPPTKPGQYIPPNKPGAGAGGGGYNYPSPPSGQYGAPN